MRVLLVVYDNDAYIHFFPQGIAYIASALIRAGHEVKIYQQDIEHSPDRELTEYLDRNKFDVVGVGVIAGYYQYKKLLAISEAINNSRSRPYYILGGHGPSPEPEYFLKKTSADAAVLGEGEVTIVELLKALENRADLKSVDGIAFRDGAEVTVNPRREVIQDINTIEMPAYDLFPISVYRLMPMPAARRNQFSMPVLSGRGCTFRCNFCYRMDPGFRPRTAESIIEEIRFLKEKYRIDYICFSDELLMCSKERTLELCDAFLSSGLDFNWYCNGRLNFAKPRILRQMKKAGCLFINYGIESMDDQALKAMNKSLNTRIITEGIEATLESGISPGFNIIFGNIGEDRKVIEKDVEFLLKYDDGAQLRTIRPVTPYPGSDLYYYAIEKGLLEGPADFYENKHLNSDLMAVNFTPMSEDEFYDALNWANQKLIDNYYRKKCENMLKQTNELYTKKNMNFRGYRHT